MARCPICLEPVLTLPWRCPGCKQKAHAVCIDENVFVSLKAECPMCRHVFQHPLLEEEIEPRFPQRMFWLRPAVRIFETSIWSPSLQMFELPVYYPFGVYNENIDNETID